MMLEGFQLYEEIFDRIGTFLPNVRVTRHPHFARIMMGLHLARPVYLSKLASWQPGRAKFNSNVRRLRRFLANDVIQSWKLYRPIARLLLESAGHNGQIRLLAGSLLEIGRYGTGLRLAR